MCTVLLLTVQMSLFTSCNDDLAADSYYTFTGEMMSDFLRIAKISACSSVLSSVPARWIFCRVVAPGLSIRPSIPEWNHF